MPIKFRCEHCDAKLSIKRTKSGLDVDCPKCSKSIVVPSRSSKEFREESVLAGTEPSKRSRKSSSSNSDQSDAISKSEIAGSSSGISSSAVATSTEEKPVEGVKPTAESAGTNSDRKGKKKKSSSGKGERGKGEGDKDLGAKDTDKRENRDSKDTFSQSEKGEHPFSEFAVFDEPDVVYGESSIKTSLPRQKVDFDRISVPRHFVYTQGALLGLGALFFLSLGIWIGRSSAKPGVPQQDVACRIQGEVYFEEDGERISDGGSVVIFLPVQRQPEVRPDPKLLHPGNRLTGDNQSVAIIRELGGDVGSVSQSGEFDVQLKSGQSYFMCVLSKSQQRDSDSEPTKQQRAEMASYFVPVDELVSDYSFRWTEVSVTGSNLTTPAVVF